MHKVRFDHTPWIASITSNINFNDFLFRIKVLARAISTLLDYGCFPGPRPNCPTGIDILRWSGLTLDSRLWACTPYSVQGVEIDFVRSVFRAWGTITPRIIHDADDDVGTAEQDGKHEFAEYPGWLVRFADNSFLWLLSWWHFKYQNTEYRVLYSVLFQYSTRLLRSSYQNRTIKKIIDSEPQSNTLGLDSILDSIA